MPQNHFPKKRYYLAIVLWTLALVAGAFLWSAQLATYAIGVTLVVMAGARAFLPEGKVPVIRSRKVDVATYLILALAVLLLASWAATPAVS
ncbi:MAG: DUF3017 domain-containing protein [Trueperella sp.]|nr:DUF3017 domain-containing protein [Trueperella sp.]